MSDFWQLEVSLCPGLSEFRFPVILKNTDDFAQVKLTTDEAAETYNSDPT